MKNLPDKRAGGDKTSDLLGQTYKAVAEGLTGLTASAVSNRKDLILSVGHIFQQTRVQGFLDILIEEWGKYRKAGRIKNDRFDTQQHQECLKEILDSLDRDSPDQLRFRMLKALFLGAATEEEIKRESPLPQQYMSLCRKLSSGEALVLQADYALVKCGKYEVPSSAGAWLEQMAKASGLQYPPLVEMHERGLIEKNIISPRTLGDKSGCAGGTEGRLTLLGIGLCHFISTFDGDFAKITPT